jgi:hypothetical protein
MAASLASAPPFVKKVLQRLPGVSAEPVGLLLDRRDDLRMLVPDVEVDELGGEVEVALPVVVPEVAALTAGHRDRADLALDRPRVEQVFLLEAADVIARLGIALDDGHRQSPSFPRVHGSTTRSLAPPFLGHRLASSER